ncbi:MAG: tRNA (guanosine(37)-N1)-methyltransferase TrmD [Magnetococcales bacterium]|nr:tRNA (guanosine(37)-N1)-methyltransferase TrmD [Magnetococcales bacterium]
MHITVLTLFPDMLSGPLSGSLLLKARQNGLLSIDLVQLRDFAANRYGQVDDRPYGGGPGMVIRADVVAHALNHVLAGRPGHVVYVSPQGRQLTQSDGQRLAGLDHLVLLCGHYEGIDERVVAARVDEEISIGDFVLTGGEIPALVIIDMLARWLPGVVGDSASVEGDSFSAGSGGILDYPHYTRPAQWQGVSPPAVLLSGHHQAIASWRRRQSLLRTLIRRPDLLTDAPLSRPERSLLTLLAQSLDEMVPDEIE